MNKTRIYIIIGLSLLPSISVAQDEDAVKEVIQRVFIAMEKGDSALLRSAFTGEATMATVFRNKEGEPMLRQEMGVQMFLNAVGNPHDDVWYEEIWNLQVKISDDLAQAWCDYAFYLGNTFHHCGVDAFQLFRSRDGWKIFHLADTRRATGCEVPSNISDKHQ